MGLLNFFGLSKKLDQELAHRWRDPAISIKLFCHFPIHKKISYFRKTSKGEEEINFQKEAASVQVILNDGKDSRRFDGKSNKDKLESFLWFYHEDLKASLEHFKKESLVPSLQTQIHIEEENRALIWLQTSFKVLYGALRECSKNSDHLFQGFVWIEPTLLRFVAFNVDCSFYFLPDQTLKVIVYNDKNQTHGSSAKPSLEVVIKGQKPAFLNEVILVLNQIGQILEKEVNR